MNRIKSSGPLDAKIAIIGEAPGATEVKKGVPFIGSSGQELRRMLHESGIDPEECFFTNTFMIQPYKNLILEFFESKTKAKKLNLDLCTLVPPIKEGSSKKYLLKQYESELLDLWQRLTDHPAKIIICVGGISTWALFGDNGITSIRGVIDYWTDLNGNKRKVISTFHPAMILRQWSNRTIVLLDLKKAKRHSEQDITPPNRTFYLNPTLSDLDEFYWPALKDAKHISFDIETRDKSITKIAFSPDPFSSYSIPFFDRRSPRYSYWATVEAEKKAWTFVRNVLDLPCVKIAQNGMFDIQYLWIKCGIPVRNFVEDTMLQHYSIMPEMPKGLGFLGSIFCDEIRWKELKSSGDTELKADD